MKKFVFLALIVGAALAFVLPSFADALKVGETAPDFQLTGSDGKTYTLSEFKGKKPVVVAWFPKAFTTGCTIECKNLHDTAAVLQHYDVAVFAASVDDVKTNTKFAKNLGLTFPILSDPTRATARAYGAMGMLPVASRYTFYISKEGKILHVDTAVNPATAGKDMAAQLDLLKVDKK